MRLLCLALAAATLSACTIVVNPGVGPLPGASTAPRPVSPTLPPATPMATRSATPVPANTAVPTTSPTPRGQVSPTPAGNYTTAPSASPYASVAPHIDGKTTIISGTVYDEQGAPVDGATVKVASLDVSVPYAAVATTSQGSWVVNNVPEGVNAEVRATKDGYTTRWQVGNFQTRANQKNVVNFDGAYFISKYPEVMRAERTGDTVSFTLSEPLDSVNRRRFQDNLRVVPSDGGDPIAVTNLKWSDSELVATLTLAANAPKCEAILLAGSERVRDKDNNPMGMDAQDAFEGPLAATDRVHRVFRLPDLPTTLQAATAEARWAATHTDSAPL